MYDQCLSVEQEQQEEEEGSGDSENLHLHKVTTDDLLVTFYLGTFQKAH